VLPGRFRPARELAPPLAGDIALNTVIVAGENGVAAG
jgi:hypothetical protein